MSEPLRTTTYETSNVTEAAREANERIAAKALRLHFLARVPFICECSDPDCRDFVLLLPEQYLGMRADGDGYVTLRGHAVADATPEACDGYVLHRRRRS